MKNEQYGIVRFDGVQIELIVNLDDVPKVNNHIYRRCSNCLRETAG